MRYYNLSIDKWVICTLNNRDAIYELQDILSACVRTYMHTLQFNGVSLDEAHKSNIRVLFEVQQDFNHDDDCGSFRIETLSKQGRVVPELAKILDGEIDLFIKERDLWNNRMPPTPPNQMELKLEN